MKIALGELRVKFLDNAEERLEDVFDRRKICERPYCEPSKAI
jgi:hypothetical protein